MASTGFVTTAIKPSSDTVPVANRHTLSGNRRSKSGGDCCCFS